LKRVVSRRAVPKIIFDSYNDSFMSAKFPASTSIILGGFLYMIELAALNAHHGIPGQLTFIEGPGGLVVAEVTNAHASATLVLQGAQMLTWAPIGQSPVIWLSRAARFVLGKSIRGGAPVCWPWFGAHPEDKTKPAHGFARNLMWQVSGSAIDPDGAPQVKLRLQDSDQTRALWPYAFTLELSVTAGDALLIEMSTTNNDDKPFTITEALHTYFAIGDIHQATVTGLDVARYWDKTENFAQHTQSGPVKFEKETDRVYQSDSETTIEDPAWNRRICIAKSGSASTVVWNPWIDISRKMEGMGETAWQGMLCVETANAMEDGVRVQPGGSHVLMARISVEDR